MTTPPHRTHDLTHATWRKSSHSNERGECVELSPLDEETIAVRNSNHPAAGTVYLTRTDLNAWLRGIKAGEYDDLT